MPKTESRDGKFIISAPDTARTLSYSWSTGYVLSVPNKGTRVFSRREEINKDMFDKETDVYLQPVEGWEISLVDVANAIWYDCFYEGGISGLGLLSKRLNVHVTIGEKSYNFNLKKPRDRDQCVITIASQLKL